MTFPPKKTFPLIAIQNKARSIEGSTVFVKLHKKQNNDILMLNSFIEIA